MRRLIATLLVGLLAVPASAEDWVYTFRPGDTVWNLAEKYCGSHRFADRIVRHNQLDRVRYIRPGTRLKIPIQWLVKQPVEAEILRVRGEAWLHAATSKLAQVGDRIAIGDRVETGAGSVFIRLADGSTIAVKPDSQLQFQVMSAFGDTGMVDTLIRVDRGRATTRAARQARGSRLRVASPAGTAAVRGTEFRYGVSEEATLTETLEGEVVFSQTQETTVPAGFGVRGSSQGVIKEALLEAPSWLTAPGKQKDGAGYGWTGLKDANRYRVSVFESGDLQTPVYQEATSQTRFTAPQLNQGSYELRVRGVSSVGLEGYEAALAIEIAPDPPLITEPNSTSQVTPNLRWSGNTNNAPFVLQVATTASFEDIVLQQEVQDQSAAPNLPPGKYQWRVRDSESVFSEVAEVVVAPAAVTSLQQVTPAKGQATLQWQGDSTAQYHLIISRDASFANPVVDIITAQNDHTTPLAPGKRYYARVTAQSNGVSSEPTDLSFVTKGNPPWWLLSLLLIPIAL